MQCLRTYFLTLQEFLFRLVLTRSFSSRRTLPWLLRSLNKILLQDPIGHIREHLLNFCNVYIY